MSVLTLRAICRPGQNPANMAISPITGELVPLSEMAEHMRISLIDPQWKTQREAMLSKIRETTQASDDEISRNLVDLAGHRPDVFGEVSYNTRTKYKPSIILPVLHMRKCFGHGSQSHVDISSDLRGHLEGKDILKDPVLYRSPPEVL